MRPASTPRRMACAIAIGSRAAAMPVFMSTASTPSSIAIAASDAVPTPASTITGNLRAFFDDRNRIAIADAEAAADRRAERHNGRTAHVLEAFTRGRIVDDVGQHGEAVAHEFGRGRNRLRRIGIQRVEIADHFEFDETRAE